MGGMAVTEGHSGESSFLRSEFPPDLIPEPDPMNRPPPNPKWTSAAGPGGWRRTKNLDSSYSVVG